MPCRKSVHLQVDLLTPIVSCMNPVSLHMGHNASVIPLSGVISQWSQLEHLPRSSPHSPSSSSSTVTRVAEAQHAILWAHAFSLALVNGSSPPFCVYNTKGLALSSYRANGFRHYHFDRSFSRVCLRFAVALQSQHDCLALGPETNVLGALDSKALQMNESSSNEGVSLGPGDPTLWATSRACAYRVK
jgi:hypothetical protein